MTRRGLVLCALGTGVVLAVAAGLAARVPEDIGGMTRDRAELYIAADVLRHARYMRQQPGRCCAARPGTAGWRQCWAWRLRCGR